ncbi:MAG TPA: heme peroxidase family protein, partial [Vicinamibacterales bacterium]|nr:heme peroxidase family protein [Vicinamibacterales bacterium]
MNGKKSPFSPNHVSRRRFIQSVSAGAVATAAIAGGVIRPVRAANAIPVNRFGRMFPTLPSFASQSKKMEQALMALGEKGGLLDANDDLAAGPVALITDPSLSANNPNNPTHGAGVTFMGQFIDHDLTLDTTSQLAVQAQPEKTINQRTPYFDLDSIYGNGPSASAELYDPLDPAKLKVETGGLFEDVPRDLNGRALLGDARNDENIILSGLHAAFLLFHNRAVDELRSEAAPEADVFQLARRLTTWHYQWMVVHEFLPLYIGQNLATEILEAGPRYVGPEQKGIPVEFQTGAYRFGHSMVRPSYRANLAGDNGQPFFGFIFDPAEFGKVDGDDLTGGSRAPRRFIGWQTFFNFGDGELKPNKKIDTHVSTPLFNLPPIAIPGGPSVLVQRTLLRHLTWQIPSGQRIARAMGAPILSDADLQELSQFDNSLLESTPLFYYVLKEAELVESGEHLGPVGGRIVGEVFVNNLRNDPDSYLNVDPNWVPTVGGGSSFRMTNFLTYA